MTYYENNVFFIINLINNFFDTSSQIYEKMIVYKVKLLDKSLIIKQKVITLY
ncbi:MAG: hypothetical protein BWZ00_01885 [Bacteroidetes bacterium ADurb.BinA174]|jgi:hypothetical protein|nr:MAG: hypothetical protein BWZ00_01885 [Bacteroidetes bacterium ADurb.BinA174]